MKFIICLFLLLLTSYPEVDAQYVYPKRELRGAWIATVANIDWPSSNQETSGEQIAELKKIFDKLHAAGINTVFFQVRTECDALYDSPYEPWAYWLTGQQGKAPSPYYDPLKLAIKEAHSRGMEIHAWLNPLRVMKKDDDFPLSKDNIYYTHPGWILKFGRYKMLNPGIPAVRSYVAKIVGYIVRRYNVDGIHFDDYFYPYTPKIRREDRHTFLKYNNGIKNINNWRRDNINRLIEQVHDTIEAVSPKVEFGVSPFGIIRNEYADTKGFEAYNVLYCDPLIWIKNKTVDYLIPQLYWEIGNKWASYKNLLLWWASAADGVHLYIGNYATKMASPNYRGNRDELEKQLRINRQIIRVDGTVFYSAKAIVNNYSGLADSLKTYFKYLSLIPADSKKDSIPPLSPYNITVEDSNGLVTINWRKPAEASDGDSAFLFVVYCFKPGENINTDNAERILKVLPGGKAEFEYQERDKAKGQYVYAVTSVDRSGNESAPAICSIRTK